MRVLLAAAVYGLAAASAVAEDQDCQAAIERIDKIIAAGLNSEDMTSPSQQAGDTSEKQPQDATPEDDGGALVEGPTRQTGEAAEEDPQFGNPMPAAQSGADVQSGSAESSEQSGASPADLAVGTPLADQGRVGTPVVVDGAEGEQQQETAGTNMTAGPSRQSGEVAESQPQQGNPLEDPAPEHDAGRPRTLTSAQRQSLADLRERAAEHAGAGREQECLDAFREADRLLGNSSRF